jgi:hypothetical protein
MEDAGRLHNEATHATTLHDMESPAACPTTKMGSAELPLSTNGSGKIVTPVSPSSPAAASTTTTTKRDQ